MKPLPGWLETYVRARLAWEDAGSHICGAGADAAAVFALVARECGSPEQPETLLEAVERLAAFKREEV